uniref:PocR domain-containing protein n=1 Tax=uncultured bacterium contig00142 TaxID=1181584 RepID=A0A806KIU3_9BACT|nr:hypothetical protein [uncultured bacterium contig00142]
MKDTKIKTTDQLEKMMLDYNQATGTSISIYDNAYNPQHLESTGFGPEKTVCPYCVKYPCHEMHKNAVKEAEKKGSFHIYQCGLGFVFWTSPIYTEGCFSGAIRGCGFLAEKQKTVDIFSNANNTSVMCNTEISKEEFRGRVNSFPGADGEKVQSLAEMMQLCAESLSTGSEDYHEIIKRRAEQQEEITKIIEELNGQYNKNEEKPGYPLEKEKKLMAALRKGDAAETKNP